MAEFKKCGEFATVWVGGLGLLQCEEIVRCGDCEWFKEGVVAGKLGKLPNQCLRPTYSGERLELTPEPDDFCSWGARREE